MAKKHVTPSENCSSEGGKAIRKRGSRLRTCADCGLAETIRADNPSTLCKRCCSVRGGLKAGALRSVAANRVPCSGCGVSIQRAPSNLTVENFCNAECRAKTRNLDRHCKQCGVVFRVYRSVVTGPSNASGNFCSQKCYHEWLLAGATEKAHFVQIKGPRRDSLIGGRPCSRCGSPEDIEIHHVIPRRVGGADDPDNLIPLCGHCHSIIECITRDLIIAGIELTEIPSSIAPELRYA